VGSEMCIRDRLRRLDVENEEWLDAEGEKISKNGKYRYCIEETRIGILACLLKGRPVHLVLNFIPKFKARRFVYLLHENAQRETIFSEEAGGPYEEKKHADLSAIFRRVVEHCAGVNIAENVGPEASLLVHKVMLTARARGNEHLRKINREEAYSASLQAYGKYLIALDAK